MTQLKPKITEKQLQASIVKAARSLGWRDAWTWRSVHSPKGWPDLVLGRGLRLLIVELKSERGNTTPEQDAWLSWWRTFGEEVNAASSSYHFERCVDSDPKHDHPEIQTFVWRPSDLDSAYRVLVGERSVASG